jgi:hypothetical protein
MGTTEYPSGIMGKKLKIKIIIINNNNNNIYMHTWRAL